MITLWSDDDFSASELERWATEVGGAAWQLPATERESFLAVVCAGSPRLLQRARTLVTDAWPLPSATAFAGSCRPGDIVSDCIVLRPIGRGGMGEVYLAIQRSLRRLVAVKVVPSGVDRAPIEAATAARLLHPNIVAVHDADLGGDRVSIVMEFVEGISLRGWLDARWQNHQAPPSLIELRSILTQIALGLGEAHRHGVVHLDVKPENILVTKRDGDYTIKVADFGIARKVETPSGETRGTAGYVAPEQIKGQRPDARADVFALGVIVYEMLTGKQPFSGRSPAETYFNTLSLEPALPSEPALAPIVTVARRALQKEPEARYQTVQELIRDLNSPATEGAEDDCNPLLSELPASVQRWWSRHHSGALFAFVSLTWGAATLWLSATLGAACVRVLWSATGAADAGYQMFFGYAVEPNAGLWYLLGSPVMLLAGCGLLDAAYRGLLRTTTLTTIEPHQRPLATLAAANRRVFRYITPTLTILAFAFVAIPELVYRRDHAFGWVQADLAGSYMGATYQRLRKEERIGQLPPVESLCTGCQVRVSAVSNGPDGFAVLPPLPFAIFLALALGHQVVFAAFTWWIAAKILFFFWILSTALFGGAGHGLRLSLDFQDTDDYRFGLGRMDNVYYAILWLIVIGAVGLFLQTVANVMKGTYFFGGDPAPALFGQVVSLLGIVALLLVVLATPVCVFLFLHIKAVDQELARLSAMRRNLEVRLESGRSAQDSNQIRTELGHIVSRRQTVKKQSLLPFRQPMFLALLSVSILMLLALPLGIGWVGASGDSISGSHLFRTAICAMTGNPQSLR